MQNFNLLRNWENCGTRCCSSVHRRTIEEMLLSAEYILSGATTK